MLVIALACVVGYVANQVLQAKSSLEAAQASVTQIQSQLSSLDVSALSASATDFAGHAHDAATYTNDPLYKLAEIVPVVGPNLTAVRELSGSLDSIGSQVLLPVVDFSKTLTPASLKPVDGKLNVALLTSGDATLASADAAIVANVATISAIPTDGTVSQISSAKTQLVTALGKAHTEIGTVRSTVATVQSMLGMNGPRHYVLAFLNNAETTGLGGGPASLSMLTVDNGAFALTDHASSQDFPLTDGPVRDIDQNVKNIFGTGVVSTLNWSTARPDFPTAALTIQAFWQKYKGGTVDGVISIDPIALSYLLKATGPMTLTSGEQITADNAVPLLLHDIYLRFPPLDIETGSDAFFKDAAATVFSGITSTSADPQTLIDAVNKGIDSGNILAWSPIPAEQKLIASSPLQGVLPTDNAKSTLVGTYFRDVTTSKADYWIQSHVDLSTDVCTNPTNPTFTETVTLHSTMTVAESETLPRFVVGGNFGGTQVSTEVYIYGPVGASTGEQVAGTTSVSAAVRSSASDLGRPVARFLVNLKPGETNTVTASFSGVGGVYGPPVIQTTPMMNTTTTALTAAGCK
ncbi:DUF4012 domain-containing protein [Subtercola vilae]|uniref:DUF4012 domain-containing protein n=1 Tax=Subtercola vilae TaxID=2056433 RepID=A0A4T2C318_9MICO|nr:DUF4012 domain-containing protein [Subtercola vilae]TIH37812.1 DUF4012 domain-containing protein [Subtercola vilae]